MASIPGGPASSFLAMMLLKLMGAAATMAAAAAVPVHVGEGNSAVVTYEMK